MTVTEATAPQPEQTEPRSPATRTPAEQGYMPTEASRKRTADGAIERPAKSARNRRGPTIGKSADVVDLTGGELLKTPVKKAKTPRKKKDATEGTPERRARVFRNHPPKTYLDRAARATSQRYVYTTLHFATATELMFHRMFVIGKTVADSEGILEMKFDIVGTTGNIYKTTIGKEPSCDCPDARKGNQCKHICYGT